jgi:hypothetical protein
LVFSALGDSSWWSKSSLTTKDTKDTAGIGYVDDQFAMNYPR